MQEARAKDSASPHELAMKNAVHTQVVKKLAAKSAKVAASPTETTKPTPSGLEPTPDSLEVLVDIALGVIVGTSHT